MRILLTNDDGVFAPGLGALAAALATAGHDVFVVAPLTDWSGMGAALGPVHVTGRIGYERVSIPELPAGSIVVGVDGPPALAVLGACLGGFGDKPDLVVSGINSGANVGQAVLHSGTVGAALTALSFDVPALAVSLDLGSPPAYGTAAEVAVGLAPRLPGLGRPVVLNVNVPNVLPGRARGLRMATLAKAGVVQAHVRETEDEALQLTLPTTGSVDPGSDLALLAEGWITLTALREPQAADLGRLTERSLLVHHPIADPSSGGRMAFIPSA